MIAPNDNEASRYYDPQVTLYDVAAWLNVSYGTARRRLHQMKIDLGIDTATRRVTKSIVMRYFGIAQHK